MKRRFKLPRRPGLAGLVTLVGLFVALALLVLFIEEARTVANFDDCVKAGYKVFEDEDPQRCVSPDGRVFVAKSDFKPSAQADAAPGSTQTNVAFDIVVQSEGPFAGKLATAIRTAKDWQAIWSNQLFAGVTPLPPLLPLDFSKEMLLAVADGPRPTTGFHTKIESVTETGGQLIVGATAYGPGKNCRTTPAAPKASNFYSVVRVPQSKLPAVFQVKSQLTDC